MRVYFIGYVEYEPTHFHGEFVVEGHSVLPDGSQVGRDTLERLKIPLPEYPNYYKWLREKYERKKAVEQMLRQLSR